MNKFIVSLSLSLILSCSNATVIKSKDSSAGFDKKKYISAESGLILREGQGQSFKRIALMPFNSEVIVIETGNVKHFISSKYDTWVKVQWSDPKTGHKYEGWCFNGFLSNSRSIRVSDLVFNGDPALNIKLNEKYMYEQPDENNESGTSKSYLEYIEFLPGNMFTYITSSSCSYDMGETISVGYEYNGSYKVEDKTVYLTYREGTRFTSTSSDGDMTENITGQEPVDRSPQELQSAESDQKSYLKSDSDKIYVREKNGK